MPGCGVFFLFFCFVMCGFFWGGRGYKLERGPGHHSACVLGSAVHWGGVT